MEYYKDKKGICFYASNNVQTTCVNTESQSIYGIYNKVDHRVKIEAKEYDKAFQFVVDNRSHKSKGVYDVEAQNKPFSDEAPELPNEPSQEEIDYLRSQLDEKFKELIQKGEEIGKLYEVLQESDSERSFLSEKMKKVSDYTLKLFTKIETFFQLYDRSETKEFNINLVSSFSRIIDLEKNNLEVLLNTETSDDLPF